MEQEARTGRDHFPGFCVPPFSVLFPSCSGEYICLYFLMEFAELNVRAVLEEQGESSWGLLPNTGILVRCGLLPHMGILFLLIKYLKFPSSLRLKHLLMVLAEQWGATNLVNCSSMAAADAYNGDFLHCKGAWMSVVEVTCSVTLISFDEPGFFSKLLESRWVFKNTAFLIDGIN